MSTLRCGSGPKCRLESPPFPPLSDVRSGTSLGRPLPHNIEKRAKGVGERGGEGRAGACAMGGWGGGWGWGCRKAFQPEFGAYRDIWRRFEIALEPSELLKGGEPGKGRLLLSAPNSGMHQTLDGQNRQSPINSRKPFRSSMWNEC